MADKCENRGCGQYNPDTTAGNCNWDWLYAATIKDCKGFTTTPTQSVTVEKLNDSERKAKAFDWFIKEMMDEELEVLMKKGNYKTPLEAIEKAMITTHLTDKV